MRRQVWSLTELRNILLAANQASGLSVTTIAKQAQMDTCQAYRQGFQAALLTIAIAIGIPPLEARATEDEK